METILVIDDHPIVLEGVSLVLKKIRPEAQIITVPDATKGLREVEANPDGVDWVLVDIKLPDMSGLDFIRKLRAKKVLSNIVILSSEITPDIIEEALEYKVNGVLSKHFEYEVFLQCFTEIEQGAVFLTPKHAKQLEYYRQGILLEKKHIKEKISERQYETLHMIAKGYSNKEIADLLRITESTVKSHASSLMTLFDADNRTHCVSEAQRLKII